MGGVVMARPIELDDLKAQRICAAIAAGNTRRCAAAAAGVSVDSLITWVRRGRSGEEPFAAFAARVQKADAEAEEAKVKVIGDAAEDGSWQAAAWWLERRRRRTWRRPPMEQAPSQDTDYSQLTDAQLEQALTAAQELRKKAAANG